MERLDQFTVPEVFAWVKDNADKKEKRVEFHGQMMKPKSARYQNFIDNGTTCTCCGVEGTFFARERNSTVGKKPNTNGAYHFNLYAKKADGSEVLMTKGFYSADNGMETHCAECNSKLDSKKQKAENKCSRS